VRARGEHVVRRLTEPLLTLAAGLAAAIPVITATVKAIHAGWVPLADRGIIATRAHDVLTSHMPLVGQYTLAGEVTGEVTHSLGPMLFWLLAIPAHADSTVGMTITMGALNTLCIVGSVALARLRSGRVLMVMSALAIALMCQSLAAETFHDIWNPSAGLFPFTLLIFLCWSLACGEYRLAPLTVLVASFVAQTHLTYLPPTLGLLAVGFGGLAVGSIARQRRRAPGLRRRALVGWTLATLLLTALCWSATLAGQLSEHPGNLTLVAEAATRHKAALGSNVGWHAVVRAVGIVPWWLHTPTSRWQRKYEVRATPSPLATDSTIAILAALALVGLLALRRRRRDLAALALVALVLCPALGAVAAATPTPRLLSATLGYTMWWGSQVGMVAWLTLAWALWLVLAALARRLTGRVSRHLTSGVPHPRATALLAVSLTFLGVGLTAAVGETVAANGKPDEHALLYRPVKAIDARLARLIPRGGSVLLEGNLDGATMPVKPAVRYFLVTRGTRVLAPGSALRLGTWYELYHRPYREALYLSDVPRAPARRVTLVFHTSFREGTTLNTVYVWRSPQPGR
jgi:MYXO-CTERM domain-containing protein